MWQPYIHFPKQSVLAPGLELEVYHELSRASATVKMKIDTGASMTVLPLRLITEDLKDPPPYRITDCTDYNGNTTTMPVYLVNLKIYRIPLLNIEVIGGYNPRYGLLGLNVLKKFMLCCNGQKEKFKLNISRKLFIFK